MTHTANNAQDTTSPLTCILQQLDQQADTRMGLHGLRQLVTTSLLQVVAS